MRDDIAFAHQRVRDFAQRQRDSLAEFEVELMSGLVAGQKLIPANTAGCYVPGGRYAHAASRHHERVHRQSGRRAQHRRHLARPTRKPA